MKLTVDRKEEGFLVLLLPDGEKVNISDKICPEAKEGDILNIEILKEETENKKEELEKKLDFLKNRNI